MDTRTTLTFRQRVVRSPFGRLATVPARTAQVARYDASVVRASASWLMRSREFTNYTYDLTPLNQEHLAWFCALVTGRPVAELRGYLREIQDDRQLRDHVTATTKQSVFQGVADPLPRLGRRMGWYAITRALHPAHVVETGTEKGLGSITFAAALLRNGHGRLTTIDVVPDLGWLITGPYAEVVDRVVADSVETLRSITKPVDVFLHDSLHSAEHERAEFDAVESHLANGAVVLSDNSHATAALSDWAEATGRRFTFFGERPAGHWYPGAGIGAALADNPDPN